MVILSHSGKQHSYQVAKALDDMGMLECFYTSSYVRSKWLQDFFVRRGDQFWTRRFIGGLWGKKVDANWRFEVKEIVLRQLQGKSRKAQEAVYQRDIDFDRYVAKKLYQQSCRESMSGKIFWGFQGSCYESLQMARSLGMKTVVELATAHVTAAERILGEESRLHPEWASTIDNLVFPDYYHERLEQEPHLADYVVAASQFTAATLKEVGIEAQSIITLPLGFDGQSIAFEERKGDDFESRPMRLLYAGTVTQRKGIKYLLEVMRQLRGTDKNIELHIIGGIQHNTTALEQYKGLYSYHTPVSQQQLFELYGTFDALVLPTLFEGFGLVIVEAMAAGLPVITSPHSIGPDVIENDKNGYIVPIRDEQALREAILHLRQKSSLEFAQMRRAAREAALGYSWEEYGKRLEKGLRKIKED